MKKILKIKKKNDDKDKEETGIEEPKEETKNEADNNKKLVKRKNRSKDFPVLDPGWYNGEIVDATLKEFPSDYNKSGLREVVVIDISVIADDGTEVMVKKFDNFNFHKMSNLSATLRELGIEKPGVDEYLDLSEFIGEELEVRIGNKDKNGNIYNTVESIKGM